MVAEMSKLTGKLTWLGQTAPWIFHLMIHIYSSIAAALQANTAFLINTPSTVMTLIKEVKCRIATAEEDMWEIKFAISAATKRRLTDVGTNILSMEHCIKKKLLGQLFVEEDLNVLSGAHRLHILPNTCPPSQHGGIHV